MEPALPGVVQGQPDVGAVCTQTCGSPCPMRLPYLSLAQVAFNFVLWSSSYKDCTFFFKGLQRFFHYPHAAGLGLPSGWKLLKWETSSILVPSACFGSFSSVFGWFYYLFVGIVVIFGRVAVMGSSLAATGVRTSRSVSSLH